MTEKENELKSKVVEKRVKKTVIRRRKVRPTPEEKAAAEQVVKDAEAAQIAAEAAAATPGVVAAPQSEVEAEPGAEAEAESKPKVELKAEAEAAAETPVEPAEAEARDEKPAKAPAKKTDKPDKSPDVRPVQADGVREDSRDKDKGKAKREVKVFNKEVKKVDKTFPGKQMYRRGKRYQMRDNRRRSNISPSRELKKTEITVTRTEKRIVRIAEAISVAEFSQKIGVKAGDIIRKLMDLGIMATVNQTLDIESATIIAQNYDYEVESVALQE